MIMPVEDFTLGEGIVAVNVAPTFLTRERILDIAREQNYDGINVLCQVTGGKLRIAPQIADLGKNDSRGYNYTHYPIKYWSCTMSGDTTGVKDGSLTYLLPGCEEYYSGGCRVLSSSCAITPMKNAVYFARTAYGAIGVEIINPVSEGGITCTLGEGISQMSFTLKSISDGSKPAFRIYKALESDENG